MIYYKKLDLPLMSASKPRPDELGDLIFDNQGEDRGYLRSEPLRWAGCKDYRGQRLDLARYQRYKLGRQYLDQILSLIPELEGHVRDWGYQRIYNQDNNPQGAMMLTHTDGERRGQHCIQALWATGGEGVQTTWWKEPDKEIIRDSALIITIPHTELELLEQAEFKLGEWAVFRTDVLHSVQSIQGDRNSFSVGFTNDDLYQTIIEKYARS
jgi:hypothetical protein